MREITKNIELEIDGERRQFRITKMDAFGGMYLFKMLTEKCLPVLQKAIKAVDGSRKRATAKETENVMSMVPELLSSVSEDDLKTIMTRCLQTVECSLPAGWQAVVDRNGGFGIAELEYDLAGCLNLCYQVIAFNCGGFISGGGLNSLLKGLNGSSLMR